MNRTAKKILFLVALLLIIGILGGNALYSGLPMLISLSTNVLSLALFLVIVVLLGMVVRSVWRRL